MGRQWRINGQSTKTGQLILDAFCCCATACVAADRLGRQWVGINLSPLAGQLVATRMQRVCSRLSAARTFRSKPTWYRCRTTAPTIARCSANKRRFAGDLRRVPEQLPVSQPHYSPRDLAGEGRHGSSGQLPATVQRVQLDEGEGEAGGIDCEVQQRGDSGGLKKEKTMRGRALQKLCKVVFGRNNLTGTDFRDVMAWRVKRQGAQELEGGVLIQFVVTSHALGKVANQDVNDALDVLLPAGPEDR